MIQRKHLLKALLIIFIMFGFSRPVLARAVTVVSINPASVEVGPGETFSVDVVVTDVTDLWAFDVMISYDPDIIEYDHFVYGDFLEEGITFMVPHDPGSVQCVLSQKSSSDPQSGTGVLVTFYFVTKQVDGESDIILEIADLSNIDGEIISADLENGFVQVGESKKGMEVYIPLMLFNSGKN